MICQWFSWVTKSLVKIIGKSSHEWSKKLLFVVTNVLLYFLRAILCLEYIIPLQTWFAHVGIVAKDGLFWLNIVMSSQLICDVTRTRGTGIVRSYSSIVFAGAHHWSPISLVPHLIDPPSHWSPISLVPHVIGLPNGTHAPPISLVPHLIGPPDSLVPRLIGPPSHWSPISLVPQLAPMHHPFHWSPISLVPHPIGPFSPVGPPIHKSPPHCLNSMAPFSLVPPCNPFSCSHWSPISLVPQSNPGYTVPIGPPSHWSPSLTLSTLFSLVPKPWSHSSHWSPISLVPQCNPGYTVLIGPPSHWLPLITFPTLLSLVPHLIGPFSGPQGSVLSTPQILDPIFGVWIGPTLWVPKWDQWDGGPMRTV